MQKAVHTASASSRSTEFSVGRMFDAIAPTYDRLNHLLSLGRDFTWRRQAAGQLRKSRALKVIDLATGTGDLLISILQQHPNISEAVGLDVSANMLGICREKLSRQGLIGRVELRCADASATPFPEHAFDAATMAFGIRNTPDVSCTLREMCRILKPGGTAVILEFSLPKNRVWRRCYLAYLRLVVPLIGALVSGDKRAYRYLEASIESFHGAEEFLALMAGAGFSQVSAVPLTCGVACIYRGSKDRTE